MTPLIIFGFRTFLLYTETACNRIENINIDLVNQFLIENEAV